MKKLLSAFALIAIFMPYAFTAEYNNSYDPGAMRIDGSNASHTVTLSGFTKFGELGTGIKMKVLTGTTEAAQGGTTYLEHGIASASNILFWTASIEHADSSAMPPEFTSSSGYEYETYKGATQIVIILSAANSSGLLSKPVTSVIWYKE